MVQLSLWARPRAAPCQRVCVLQGRANSKQYVGLISLQPILALCMGETSLGRELSFAPLFSSPLPILSRSAAPGTGSLRWVADGELSLYETSPELPEKPLGRFAMCRAPQSPRPIHPL